MENEREDSDQNLHWTRSCIALPTPTSKNVTCIARPPDWVCSLCNQLWTYELPSGPRAMLPSSYRRSFNQFIQMKMHLSFPFCWKQSWGFSSRWYKSITTVEVVPQRNDLCIATTSEKRSSGLASKINPPTLSRGYPDDPLIVSRLSSFTNFKARPNSPTLLVHHQWCCWLLVSHHQRKIISQCLEYMVKPNSHCMMAAINSLPHKWNQSRSA